MNPKTIAGWAVALTLVAVLMSSLIAPQIASFYSVDWGSTPTYIIVIAGLIFLFAFLGLALKFMGGKDK